ncbi:hypothetical protein [Nostoc sp. UHCC 0252]|uniref:hypothetical protein n=1 Tax=Nostoc sp. UHCC 0252 TaxID=3110241 RepID=UPI002B20CBBA|nr:hypothetical protein [Nostoc sp. UHCC 0252]MEA5603409.1 hypothetical protein [Nostoc sp. UHCC 0252]
MSMNIHQKHLTSQIEITNLIEEAVVNASARRNQASDAEETLLELSEEEEKNIRGGVRIVIGGFLLLNF